MKKFQLISTLMFASSANAELALSHNSFWQGFYNNDVEWQITAEDKTGLAQACKDYKKSLYVQSDLLDKKELDERRKIGRGHFDSWVANANFNLDQKRNEENLRLSLRHAANSAASDPRAQQFKSVNFESVEGLSRDMQGSLHVVAASDSLSAVSYKLGLVDLPVYLVDDGEKAFIKFTGFDSACDFLNGNAFLEFQSQASLLLSLESAQQLLPFYEKLSEKSLAILRQKGSMRKKAAVIGLQVGTLYQELSGLEEDALLENFSFFMDEFFTNDLVPNALWRRKLNGEVLHLNMPLRQVETFHVQVRNLL